MCYEYGYETPEDVLVRLRAGEPRRRHHVKKLQEPRHKKTSHRVVVLFSIYGAPRYLRKRIIRQMGVNEQRSDGVMIDICNPMCKGSSLVAPS